MEAQLTQIRDQQKETWDSFSPGWKKWDSWVTEYLQAQAEAMIDRLDLKNNDVVLDVATGTGEPGISIARIAREGRVLGVDISEGMLSVARENAEKKGVMNYSSMSADACELPFLNDTFNVVSCRLGFMFFPDMELAAREMVRVLKANGRLATTVWSAPETNPWVGLVMGPIMRHMDLPQPPPDAPGMFRCAKPGMLKELFERAGLKNVKDEEITGHGEAGSLEQFWTYMNDVAAPVVSAMSKADAATRQRIKEEVFEAAGQLHQGDGPLKLPWGFRVISGRK